MGDLKLGQIPSQTLFNELARRYKNRVWLGSDCQDVNALLDAGLHLRFEPEEHVKVLYLAVNGQHIAEEVWTMSEPGQVDLKIRHIIKQAIMHGASQMAVIHNHPCGTADPSDGDILGTCRLIEASRHLNLTILDHLIVAESGYFSMQESGVLQEIKDTVKQHEVCSRAVVVREAEAEEKPQNLSDILKKQKRG